MADQNYIDHALKYCKRGFSIVPLVPNGKKPLIKWKKLQETPLSEDEIKEIWTKNPSAGIGAVCGKVSDLVVIDADGEEAFNFIRERGGIPICPQVNSGSGKGQHYYWL